VVEFLTAAQLESTMPTRLAEMLNDDADPTANSATNGLDEALSAANGLARNKIRARYDDTNATIAADPVLRACVIDITLYELSKATRADLLDEKLRANYDDAITKLNDIRDGKDTLDFPPTNRNQTQAAADSLNTGVGTSVTTDTKKTAVSEGWFSTL